MALQEDKIRQIAEHIGHLRAFLCVLSDNNWLDIKLYCERQLDDIADILVTLPSLKTTTGTERAASSDLAKATSRPWSWQASESVDGGIYIGNGDNNAAFIPGYNDDPHNIANAELICRAVNAYTDPRAAMISVKTALPEIDQTVIVCFKSDYDNHPVFAWGARLDDDEGWLWGIGGRWSVRPDRDANHNDIDCDDDYRVTHWMPLPQPPGSPAVTDPSNEEAVVRSSPLPTVTPSDK